MDNLVTMSFPGLGIGEFSVNKVAFTVFGRDVRWYGIVITLGMLFAVFYALYRCKTDHFTMDDVVDLALCVIVPGVLGARIYYVLNTLGEGRYDSFYDVIAIWNGGLAIYGGIIGGAIGLIICCLVKKKNPLAAFDFAAPGCMVAQALGRWGNFFNGEAYGGIVEEGSFLYCFRMGLKPNDFTGNVMSYVHPTFLYESVWNLLGFIWINATYKHRKFRGQILFSYLAWYGFGRFWIEQLRSDSLYLGNTNIRISQWLGALCFVGALTALIIGFVKSGKAKHGAEDEPQEPVSADERIAPEPPAETIAADTAETVEPAESVETVEPVDTAENAEATGTAVPVETETVAAEPAQTPAETIEPVETVKTIETDETVETIEAAETAAANEAPATETTVAHKAAQDSEADDYDDASEGDGASAEELTSAIQRFMDFGDETNDANNK